MKSFAVKCFQIVDDHDRHVGYVSNIITATEVCASSNKLTFHQQEFDIQVCESLFEWEQNSPENVRQRAIAKLTLSERIALGIPI